MMSEPTTIVTIESTDAAKIRWICNRLIVRTVYYSVRAYTCISKDEQQIAATIFNWFAAKSKTNVAVRSISIRVRYDITTLGVILLQQYATAASISSSFFHTMLSAATEKRRLFFEKLDSERQRLIKKIEVRCGKDGCIVCGTTEGLEFDHIGPKRREVSALLYEGKFDEAEEESTHCEVRCTNHHREKSAVTNTGPPRKPFNAALEKSRETARICTARRREHGKIRLRNAKLDRGTCECGCGRKVTIDNYMEYDFDHVDPTKKTYKISEMHSFNDKVFYAALVDCRLMYHLCHKKRTAEQMASGEIATLRLNKRKRRETATAISTNYSPT